MRFLTNLDLNKNELQNVRIQNLATDPVTPVEGQIYHNTADHKLYLYNGSGWIDLTNADKADKTNTVLSGYARITSPKTKAEGSSSVDVLRVEDSAQGDLFYVRQNGDTFIGNKLTITGETTGTDLTLTGSLTVKGNSYLGDAAADVTTVTGILDLVNANIKYDASVSRITATELSYLDGVTSSIQTQLNSKINSADAVSTNTANKVVKRDGNGDFTVRYITASKITGLEAPSSDSDAVNKAYADAMKMGFDYKDSVRVATTGNIDLTAGGLLTIDTVAVVAGDRVLVKNQTTKSQNGLYTASSGTWTRAIDADSSNEVTSGMYIFVADGSANKSTSWVLSTTDPITLGTTALDFIQFGGAGTYKAGTGLSLSGITFNHSNSVTAGTISDGGSTRTLAFGGTFKIPSVTYDAQGHVTNTSTITLTMPANPNTTYSAGTGLSLSGTTFNHSNSVTAGTISDGGSARTLAFGGTFKIPSVTYDAQGHVTNTSTITLTMPANPNTNTTYSAGTGLSLSGTKFNHSNSVTAGTVSDGGSARTLAFGGTFKIPSVTYDAQGHVTSTSTITLTMPANPDTDTTYSAGTGITLDGTTFKIVSHAGTASTVGKVVPGADGKLGVSLGTTSTTAAAGNHTHSIYTRKYAADVGNGTSTSITVNHALNATDVVILVKETASPYNIVFCDMNVVDANNIKLTFATAPTSAQYRVVVIG